jgi:uncharacterized PurR-regulated membrane protein YhhQ (DUF165 family)
MKVLVYIGLVLAINIGFVHLPGWELLWSVLVGGVFIARDYAQRDVGHWVLPAMLLSMGLSWWLASPEVAVASAAAFLLSESADWLVYTFHKGTFAQRILLSSMLAVPIDTIAFLYLIDFLTPELFFTQVLSKSAALLWVFHARRSPA